MPKDPDLQLYHLCQTFRCLPSDLEEQDPLLMEKFSLIDSVLASRMTKQMEEARYGRN